MFSRRGQLIAGVGLAGMSSLCLQGCGSDTTTTTPSPGPTTTTTTTVTVPPRTPGMSAADMAEYLNREYTGYSEDDPASPFGLVVSMPAVPDSFYRNIFCSSIENPVLGRTGCFMGRTDCRLSASVVNHKMLVNKERRTPMFGLRRNIGIVLNASMVESDLARCAYLFDGSSERRYNVGCGDGTREVNCRKPGTAFMNLCPSTGKVCTAADEESKRGLCRGYGGTEYDLPTSLDGQAQCAIPGVAIDFHGQEEWRPSQSSGVRQMVDQRAKVNDDEDNWGPNCEKRNEVVIDERLLLPRIWEDPAVAVPAIIYKKGSGDFRRQAMKLRDELCAVNRLEHKIPVVAFDDLARVDEGKGVFVAEDEAEQTMVVL